MNVIQSGNQLLVKNEIIRDGKRLITNELIECNHLGNALIDFDLLVNRAHISFIYKTKFVNYIHKSTENIIILMHQIHNGLMEEGDEKYDMGFNILKLLTEILYRRRHNNPEVTQKIKEFWEDWCCIFLGNGLLIPYEEDEYFILLNINEDEYEEYEKTLYEQYEYKRYIL